MAAQDQYDALKSASRNPIVYPLAGLVSGFILWIIDAFIDVYLLEEEQTLVENIISPEATEFWMRSLVVLVLVIMGWFGRLSMLKHLQFDRLMLEYQEKLEEQVREKTQELNRKNQALQELATRDPLTGLYNRRHFEDMLGAELSRADRHTRSVCLLLIDIDHFKLINDTHGHNTGDSTLIEFGNCLRTRLRQSDHLARWGGEEFVLLAPETTLEDAVTLAEKLRQTITEHPFNTIDTLTVSIGVAQSGGETSAGELVRHADQALYKAKKSGRNRVEAAD